MKHMLAIITTKYAGPAQFAGSRINVTVSLKSDGSTKRKTLPWLHAYDVHENHQSAAKHALWDVSCDLLPGVKTMDDIEVSGWSHDGVGHWVATATPATHASDDLRLVVEDLACYALKGWEEAMEEDRPDELAVWKDRVAVALKAVGSRYTFDDIKPLLG
jgi:hypothetical protein